MSRAGSLLVVVCMLVASAGCALRPRELRGDVFPDRSAGGQTRAAPVRSTTAATVEAGDPELSAALAAVGVAPSARLHLWIAERYRALGILDAAYDHYGHARDLSPTRGEPYEGLARVWRDWGFPDRALGDAVRGVHHAPSSAVANNTLGTVLAALGHRTDARRSFERAVALDPGAAYALNNLCYLSFLEGVAAQALGECEAALAVDPGMASARNNLALVYAVAQRDDLAEREFLAAGDSVAASYNLGLVHLAAGDFDAATRAFDAASRQRPSWTAPRERARMTRARAAKAAAGR